MCQLYFAGLHVQNHLSTIFAAFQANSQWLQPFRLVATQILFVTFELSAACGPGFPVARSVSDIGPVVAFGREQSGGGQDSNAIDWQTS